MTEPRAVLTARDIPGMPVMCVLLAAFGVFLAISGLYLVSTGLGLYGLVGLAAGAAMIAAAYGLYHMRRWGVALFAILALLGSVNHLARALSTYTSLSADNLPGAAGALLSILAGIAIPLGLIYLALLLWRRAR